NAPVSVAVGDFRGDGHLDLAVANRNSNDVSVLLGNGDGSFQAARNFSVGLSPQSLAVGDFNGGGLPDPAVGSAGRVRVLLGNGDGSLRTTNVSYVPGFVPVAAAVGDVNGDGLPDLAVVNRSSGTVSILLNDGAWPGGAAPGGSRFSGAHPGPR